MNNYEIYMSGLMHRLRNEAFVMGLNATRVFTGGITWDMHYKYINWRRHQRDTTSALREHAIRYEHGDEILLKEGAQLS